METSEPRFFKAELKEVMSGDDLTLLIDLGVDGLFKRQRVRLQGVDTPDARGQGATTLAGKIRTYVTRACRHQELYIEVINQLAHAWVVVLYVDSGQPHRHNLNDDLIKQGYKYNRETKDERNDR